MRNKRTNFRLGFAAAAVLLAVGAFFLISIFGNMTGARVDLTSDRLFTMSPAARQILQDLKVPVQVKLYITPADKMPTQLRNLERDITEQMRNYEQVADGKLEFSVYNPQDDEEMQKSLAGRGIQPFQVQSIEKDEMGIKLIWSAITIAYKDKPEEVLPRVLPQNLASLEQDVIGPVYRLTRDKAPKVAIFAPVKPVDQQLAMMYLRQGMQPPEPQDTYARLADLMQQGHYEAARIQLTEDSPVPEDADILLVMAASQLNERQVYEINRTLRRGVPVVMGVQAHEYSYVPAQGGGWTISGVDVDTGLEPMLASFGLTVSEDHFMDTAMEVIDLPREVNLGGLRMQTREPVRVPIQIRVAETQMDPDSELVDRLGNLFYLWGTPIVTDAARLQENGLTATTLASSSDDCWEESWSEGPLPGASLSPAGKTMLGAQPLVMLVEGQFPDTFAASGPPAWPTAAADTAAAPGPQPEPAVTPGPGALLLVGDAKMFDDNILSGVPGNALLLLNAADYLAGSREVLSMRAKTLTQRVIKPVSAEAKRWYRVFTVFLVPLLVAAFGITRAVLRRQAAARYRSSLRRGAAAR